MDNLLQRLTEVSIRQQQIVEHLASQQGEADRRISDLQGAYAQRVPLPDARAQAARLLQKLTPHDDVESYLQLFETNATTEGWPKEDWARVVMDRLVRALPRTHRQAVSMRNPATLWDVVEAIELAEAAHHREPGERVPPYTRRVVQEQRAPEGTPRHQSRPAAPYPADEPMPSEPNSPPKKKWERRNFPGFECLLTAAAQRPVSPGRSRPSRTPRRRTTHKPQVTRGGSFSREQHEDDRLKHCWTQVRVAEGQELQPGPHPLPHFVIKDGLLYCVAERRGEVKHLLVVPKSKTETVLELAHAHPMAGHLAATNTAQRIRDRFHWPGLEGEVKAFCRACPTCQVTSPRTPPPSPLILLPVIEVPFERIGMDLVGPLPKSARGHEHILVIVDYATRYPEAVPLRKATARNIAQELFLLFSRVGIPNQILTDQGTPFMSRVMADLCRLLKIQQLRTSVYHPQTDGLVERFNQTLKRMLKRVAADDRKDWDQMLPYVLFGVREVPQASTCFTPFELLFGRQPRGLLDVARDAWEQQPVALRSVVEHVTQMREKIERVMPMVREHLVKAQQAQQRHYNRAAQPREFQPGERVMVLVPTSACKFLAKWQGPYTILEKIGTVNYKVRQPEVGGDQRPACRTHLPFLVVVDVNSDLSAAQKRDLQHLVSQFDDVFSLLPGQTNVVQHSIKTQPGVIVRQRPYRVPEARRCAIEEEIQHMLKLGVIEPSRSPWSSPIVMVPKPDGTLRFCNDFRRLNEVSEFDGYPMPRVDELLDRLGRARYTSTLKSATEPGWPTPTPTDCLGSGLDIQVCRGTGQDIAWGGECDGCPFHSPLPWPESRTPGAPHQRPTRLSCCQSPEPHKREKRGRLRRASTPNAARRLISLSLSHRR
ncbi:Retrovirus-related Pol polyprotein [Labeo rohita]|uniref:Gypsy retrotransposon integrase-like protein 1 n=1 Tax=Labeo rohita TaxID=84645 RepID=A0ABQ8LIF0_LABRO|nr:Retrovirus-related Pol polyprotein [Labeo rohita]